LTFDLAIKQACKVVDIIQVYMLHSQVAAAHMKHKKQHLILAILTYEYDPEFQ